jgi:hypothetical protein
MQNEPATPHSKLRQYVDRLELSGALCGKAQRPDALGQMSAYGTKRTFGREHFRWAEGQYDRLPPPKRVRSC